MHHLRALALVPFLFACGSVREDPPPDDSGDPPDAPLAITPDGTPGAPDAAPGTPDAPPAPDAPPGTPDAAPEPDAPPPPECVVHADCGGSTPYCVAQHCVECNNDSACPASEPVCGAGHACTGCATDADCSAFPGAPACGPAGACVECTANADCGGATPYCATNQCVECAGAGGCSADEPVCSPADYTCGECTADSQCAIYPATPACAPSGGCVECTANADCTGTSPICEAEACRGCEAGTECATGECHLDTGACYAGSELIFLSPGGDDANPCTKSSKCRTFARAIELLTATKDTIVLAPGVYVGGVQIPATVGTVDVFGHGATIQGGFETLAQSAAVYDVLFDGSWIDSLRCTVDQACRFERVTSNIAFYPSGGQATLVDYVASSGLVGSGRPLTMRRAVFTGSGAVTINDGGWDIRNSIFARNSYGVWFTQAGDPALPHRFENNTVVDNGSATLQNQVLDLKCAAGVTGVFRNNIVWSSFTPGTGSTVTSGCPQTYSLIYTGTPSPYPGVGNLLGNPSFVRLYPSGALPADFHLTSISLARDTADPGSPLPDDIDGDHRPIGSRADIGADEFAP